MSGSAEAVHAHEWRSGAPLLDEQPLAAEIDVRVERRAISRRAVREPVSDVGLRRVRRHRTPLAQAPGTQTPAGRTPGGTATSVR